MLQQYGHTPARVAALLKVCKTFASAVMTCCGAKPFISGIVGYDAIAFAAGGARGMAMR